MAPEGLGTMVVNEKNVFSSIQNVTAIVSSKGTGRLPFLSAGLKRHVLIVSTEFWSRVGSRLETARTFSGMPFGSMVAPANKGSLNFLGTRCF